MTKLIHIWADGACSGNPGPGGWGAVIKIGKTEYEISGNENDTTNNRMEIKACIEALKDIDHNNLVEIFTDSQYVQKSMSSWIYKWLNTGFKGIKNSDLWKELYDLTKKQSQVKWTWVKGHNGNEGNERADKLATASLNELKATLPKPEKKTKVKKETKSNKKPEMKFFGYWIHIKLSDGRSVPYVFNEIPTNREVDDSFEIIKLYAEL